MPPSSLVAQSTPTPRVAWVDVSRFIALGIILVIHGQTSPDCHNWILTLVQTASVQFFFLASGYFLGKKPAIHWLDLPRFKLLFIPYLLWNLLYLAFNSGELCQAASEGISPFLHYFMTRGLGIGGDPINLPLWFLRDLALFSLLSPLFLRLPQAVKVGLLAFLIVLPTHYLTPCSRFDIPSLVGLRNFALGLLLSGFSLSSIKKLAFSPPLCWAWIGASLCISFFQGFLPGHYGEVSTWLGILALCALGVLVERAFPKKAQTLSHYAPSLFLIYASHVLFITCLFKILIPLGITKLPDWVWILGVSPLIGLLPFGLYLLLKRVAPRSLPWLAASPAPSRPL